MSSNEQTHLSLERQFEVPQAIVFGMLTEPERMRSWWGADAEIGVDLRVGGQWSIARREGGVEYCAAGEILEVEWPSLVTFTFSLPRVSPNTDTIAITIDEQDDGCVLSFEHSGEGIASELRDLNPGQTSSSEAGWERGFDLMAAAWTESI